MYYYVTDVPWLYDPPPLKFSRRRAKRAVNICSIIYTRNQRDMWKMSQDPIEFVEEPTRSTIHQFLVDLYVYKDLYDKTTPFEKILEGCINNRYGKYEPNLESKFKLIFFKFGLNQGLSEDIIISSFKQDPQNGDPDLNPDLPSIVDSDKTYDVPIKVIKELTPSYNEGVNTWYDAFYVELGQYLKKHNMCLDENSNVIPSGYSDIINFERRTATIKVNGVEKPLYPPPGVTLNDGPGYTEYWDPELETVKRLYHSDLKCMAEQMESSDVRLANPSMLNHRRARNVKPPPKRRGPPRFNYQ